MPKIFVQGEVGADLALRRDAAHSLEMGDSHADAIVCALVSEGDGEPGDGSRIACDTMHEIVAWSEDALPRLAKEMGYKLDPKRVLMEISARIVAIQLGYGDETGKIALHFAYLIAYKGEFLALRIGDAKVLHVGANGSFELAADPAAEGSSISQTALAKKSDDGVSVVGISYDYYLGTYEEGDLFLALTPGLWERLGAGGLTRAYANHRAMSEESLAELTANLICEAGKNGRSDGLTLAGVEMVSFTPYQKLGVKVS